MPIAIKKTGAAEYGQWVKVLIAGDPGKGKTRFGRSWPDPLYASAEGGLMSVADDGLPYVDIKTSEDLNQLLVALKQKDARVREQMVGVPVQTLILDTIDEIQRILVRERLAEQKRDTMQMQDWGWLGDQLRAIIRTARNLDMHVICNVHLKSETDEGSGKTYRYPAVQGAVGNEIAGYFDLAVLLDARPITRIVNGESRREVVRYMQTFPDVSHTWIKDRSGKLPMEFEITFEDDFSRLHGLVYRNVPMETEEIGIAELEAHANSSLTDGDGGLPSLQNPDPAPAADAGSADKPLPIETAVQITPTSTAVAVEEPPKPKADPKPKANKKAEVDPMVCADCGGEVEDIDLSDLSLLRFRRPLCREHFAAAKSK